MACTRGKAYIIQAGDTLYAIAQSQLGDGNRWREIMKPDGTLFTEVDAGNLEVGQEICLPSDSSPVENDPVPVEGGNGGSATGYKIVGYFENWGQYRFIEKEGQPVENWDTTGRFFPEDIDASLLTHINFAFAIFGFVTYSAGNGTSSLTGDYTIQPVEWNDTREEDYEDPITHQKRSGLYKALKNLKDNHPQLKTLLSIGGWNFNSGDDESAPWNPHPYGPDTYNLFSDMAASGSGRKQFIESAIDYAHKYGFDGIDLDWEYPGYVSEKRGGRNEDFDNFRILLKEFREKIGSIGQSDFLLTIAASAIVPRGVEHPEYKKPENYFNWLAQCAEYLDWVNVMSYDYHGAWSFEKGTGVQAPLNEVEETLRNYLDGGIPPEKIVLGMPTYGRTFKVKDPLTEEDSRPGKPFVSPGQAGPFTKTPGVLSYYEILERYPNRPESWWDEVSQTPYAFNIQTGEWVSYDNARSLDAKIDYFCKHGLFKDIGGVMIWTIGLDDFRNGFPLIKQILESLNSCQISESFQPSVELPQAIREMITILQGINRKGGEFARNIRIGNKPKPIINSIIERSNVDVFERAIQAICGLFGTEISDDISSVITQSKQKLEEIVDEMNRYNRIKEDESQNILLAKLDDDASNLAEFLNNKIQEEVGFPLEKDPTFRLSSYFPSIVILVLDILIEALSPSSMTRKRWELVLLYQVVACLHLNILMEKFELEDSRNSQDQCKNKSNTIAETAENYIDQLMVHRQKWSEYVNSEYSEIEQEFLRTLGLNLPAARWYYNRPAGKVESEPFSQSNKLDAERQKDIIRQLRDSDIKAMTDAVLGPIEEVIS